MKAIRGWADAIAGAAQTHALEDDAGPEQPPAHLTGAELDLWLIERELVETRAELHRVRVLGKAGRSTHGIAVLGRRFDDLVRRRAQLRPPPKPSADEEELRWSAQAAAVLQMIEAGVIDAEKRKNDAAQAAPARPQA